MKTLQVAFRRDGCADTARHVSGRRRSGLPVPNCPRCGALMLCVFSLDGRDEMLLDTPLGMQQTDHDVVVCVSCYMFVAGYYSRTVGNEMEVVLKCEDKGAPEMNVVLPYPVAALELLELAAGAPPAGEEGGLVSRGGEIGEYHRVTPYLLWGLDDRALDCPFCQGTMVLAMTIDTDETLVLTEICEGVAFEFYPLWGDLDYIAVSVCQGCRAFGYWHVH